MADQFRHLLRYGTHADKEYFLGSFSSDHFFDAIMLNGNMVAYSVGAMGSFVLRIDKPFFIDPQTHAFQHEIEYLSGKTGSTKSSLLKLAEAVGEPITSKLLQGKSVSASDFSSEHVKKTFTNAVVDFQLNYIKNKIESRDDFSYVQYALNDPDNELADENMVPVGVIPPYFYMTKADYHEWLEINTDFIKIASEENINKSLNTNIFGQLVISKDILEDEVVREEVAKKYRDLPCDYLMIWVDQFAEDLVTKEQLKSFRELVEYFTAGGKKVINLYGGYFSVLLTKVENCLQGVCHGLEYGESRGVVPVGGGIPRAKYYFPPLHSRLRYPDFVKLNLQKGWGEAGNKNPEFNKSVCDCPQCGNLKKFGESVTKIVGPKKIKQEFPTNAAKCHSLQHYLYTKKKEFDHVGNTVLPALLTELDQAYGEYQPILGEELTGHLNKWEDAITNKAPDEVSE